MGTSLLKTVKMKKKQFVLSLKLKIQILQMKTAQFDWFLFKMQILNKK
jgi:hypothetical protein